MNKIEQHELDKLIELNRSYRDLRFQLSDIEYNINKLNQQKPNVISNLDVAINLLDSYQEEIRAKYGNVSINLATGEYN